MLYAPDTSSPFLGVKPAAVGPVRWCSENSFISRSSEVIPSVVSSWTEKMNSGLVLMSEMRMSMYSGS